MCSKGCKKEFHPRNFKLWHCCVEHLTESPWLPLPVFVGFRVVISILCCVIWLYNVISKGKFFIFYTNWSFTVATIYFIVSSVVSMMQYLAKRKYPEKPGASKAVDVEMQPVNASPNLPRPDNEHQDAIGAHHMITWLLYNIAANMTLFLTIGYWTMINDPDKNPNTFVGVFKHLFVAIFCVIDTFMSRIPVRIYHFVYTLIATAVYLIFTIIYWSVGGTDLHGNPYIYTVLDYDSMTTAEGFIVVFFFFIVIPVVQLFYFGLAKFRDWLIAKHEEKQITKIWSQKDEEEF
ncbi:protein rolling stone isoform X2 [Nematostella vectensis]|uniref:protein rolling stone isoform X2 n=1 Tax=Nematostella vectensis TaxID=45351 RepID=UPI0013905C3D|nr:protein rolling stone isoform X2 [Nematostella vectensis]